ncbi:Helix-turn-helix domain-containing protein [Paenibacillus sp. UNCCL117]|uniref:helix-turn-helix domain-containing protein n=1 Tax=unclassified Paenibacillus TaxID=185978 RepID=UPI00088FE579|nr:MULTISPECIES: helix-turn-helix domain-containing protein [unclassified Paenibacillus]SDC05276.1 Helix-turn-helix domain-containing protein [Paenibacillus sp. cl123]SFW37541.1 Helix-turn-helix domain-containing protein [Paenibacillus sp. UNCCL117]
MRQRVPNYFMNMIVKITFFTTLIVLILSVLLYTSFRSYNIKVVNQLNESLMHQVIHNAEQIHAYIRSYSVSLTGNTDVKNLMYGENLSVYETLGSIRALDLALEANPYMESMYVYNARSDTYYVMGPNPVIRKGGAFDPQIDGLLKAGTPIPRLTPIPRFIAHTEEQPNKDAQVFTYVLPEFFRDGSTLKSAIIINVKVESFLNNVAADGTNTMDMKSLWFLGRGGEVFAHTDQELFLQHVGELDYVGRILQSPQSSGYFTAPLEGTTSVVTYVHSDLLDWKLVGVTPYDTVARTAERVKSLAIGIGVIMMTACLIAAVILTRNLYAPVRTLHNKFSPHIPSDDRAAGNNNEFEMISEVFSTTRHKLLDLQQFRNSNWLALKQKALEDFMRTGLPPARNEYEWLQTYAAGINPNGPWAVVVIRIDRYADFCEKYSEPDRALLRYALTNIAGEILRTSFACETLDMGEDRVAVILSVEEDEGGKAGRRESLTELLQQARMSFEHYCGFAFSAFVSEAAMTLREIPYLYRDALELAHNRFKAGHGCLLFREESEPAGPEYFNLNHPLVDQLLEGIQEGKPDKAGAAYGLLTELLHRCDYDNMMFAVSYLSSSIFNLLHTMESNRTVTFGLSFSEFDRKLKRMETFTEMDAEFRRLFEAIAGRIHQIPNEKTKLIVSEALRYIDEHYADNALSPHQIADLFNLTPAYLNKLCRERTSHSLGDYITHVRVEKAKQLLGETNLTIDQIIGRIGWENKKYFFRIFKKLTGATPTEYRLKLNVDQLNAP